MSRRTSCAYNREDTYSGYSPVLTNPKRGLFSFNFGSSKSKSKKKEKEKDDVRQGKEQVAPKTSSSHSSVSTTSSTSKSSKFRDVPQEKEQLPPKTSSVSVAASIPTSNSKVSKFIDVPQEKEQIPPKTSSVSVAASIPTFKAPKFRNVPQEKERTSSVSVTASIPTSKVSKFIDVPQEKEQVAPKTSSSISATSSASKTSKFRDASQEKERTSSASTATSKAPKLRDVPQEKEQVAPKTSSSVSIASSTSTSKVSKFRDALLSKGKKLKSKIAQQSTPIPAVPTLSRSPSPEPEEDEHFPVQMEASVEVIIDGDVDEFNTLVNSQINGNKVTLNFDSLDKTVSFMEPNDIEFKHAYAGIGGAIVDNADNAITGYMKIEPRTLKPMEVTQCRMIYWILNGEVTIRSTSYMESDGRNFLFGKKLACGACMLVPTFTPYTIENRSHHTPALIGYVLLKTAETQSTGAAASVLSDFDRLTEEI